MKRIWLAAALAAMVVLTGCTEQQRAKNFGGKATIQLPKGQKLITVTWKETELWYLSRSMRPDESAESYTFQENSNYGILEGKVVLEESK